MIDELIINHPCITSVYIYAHIIAFATECKSTRKGEFLQDFWYSNVSLSLFLVQYNYKQVFTPSVVSLSNTDHSL